MYNRARHKKPSCFTSVPWIRASHKELAVRAYDFIHLCLDYLPCARMDVAWENTARCRKSKRDEQHFMLVCPAVYYSVPNSLLKYYFPTLI